MASEEECLAELDSLIGLESVERDPFNAQPKDEQKKMDSELSGRGLHRYRSRLYYLFLGNPGTGKTLSQG